MERNLATAVERKLATVLFVDLVESTMLVSAQDPEIVRRRITRFFDRVSSCIATHGGIVEKFAGDAVMAAFGVPLAHEDDAERAVRAALGIMAVVSELELEARIGIESGQVVADSSDSTFATGEPVNVAARLQQAAQPGQILIGPGAYRLTLGRVETEDAGAFELRGRATPVWAWHVLAAGDGPPPPSTMETPLVGREAELELLENTLGRAIRDRRAHLSTIFGDPGVGKSRLSREFVAGLEGATVLQGRCLPYGEGITYWPLAEMVKSAAGIADDDPVEEAIEKLRATCEIEVVADLLGLASGILAAVEGESSREELAWAARAWAQKLAEVQPLVLVFEDIHWAEEPLLELIEHLAGWVRDAPLLIVCLARPELLDVRPGWGGGRVRATALELEPLRPDESEELLEALISEHDLSLDVREALLEKTEGNPLYVEETIRMVVEAGDDWSIERIPDTLQALIAARIDRLPGPQRTLLQRASVIGRVFWPGALSQLAPELGDVEPLVRDLLFREFLLEEPRSTLTGQRAYRFKHVLIREVAYAALAKAARAEHHERFAQWLGERTGEELLEIRAYHLEQACALHDELDGSCPPELAQEAGRALEAAARRALAREAFRTARKLLARSLDLAPTLERRYLAARAAWRLADFPTVSAEMEEVRAAAAEEDDRRLHGLALTALADVTLYHDGDGARAQDYADRALEKLSDDPDVDAQFEALGVRGGVASWFGDLHGVLSYAEQALAVAAVAGRKDLETLAAQALAGSYITLLEIDRARPLVARALELAEASGSIRARAAAHQTNGWLNMILENLDEAEDAYGEARRLFQEVGFALGVGQVTMMLARLAEWRGEEARAEKLLRESMRILTPLGDRGFLCEVQRRLAQLLARQDRLDEAEKLALKARETVGLEDAASLITTTMALGFVRAAQGRDEEAERLLREAAGAADGDTLYAIEPLRALVQFLRDRGRDDEAAPFEARWASISPAAAKRAARIA